MRATGGVGTKLLFENERVKIWEVRLAPGEQGALHHHALDHVLVQIEGDRVAVVPEPDTMGPFTDYMEAPITPGMAVFVPRGGVETARNVGERPYHEIVVELKD
jgi:mannose-6-phosphate isomerase-like protein (cupin superfamily)